MSVFHEYDDVDKFTVGTVSVDRVTERSSCRSAPTTHGSTVKCEKQQAAGDRAVPREGAVRSSTGGRSSDHPLPMELTSPIDAVFVLGPIGLGYDRSNDKVLLQLRRDRRGRREWRTRRRRPAATCGSTSPAGRPRAFAQHAEQVIESRGGPSAHGARNPMDPDGHACPRMN